MGRWWMVAGALVLIACTNDSDVTPCGLTVCTDGVQCCVGCEGNHFCSTTCPPLDACPDAGGGATDAGDAPTDASGVDAGGPVDGGEVDAGDDDAGPGPEDAGVDAAAPDAGPLCEAEVCDGEDDDCDSRIDEDADCPCPVMQGTSGNAYLLCDLANADEVSWTEARSRCEAVGYSLVVIEDAAEDALLFGELDSRGFGDTWIGLNDRDTEMTWEWVDGTPLGYEHWDAGEPNDGDGDGEDCGIIMLSPPSRESEWDDRTCTDTYDYVCEAPP